MTTKPGTDIERCPVSIYLAVFAIDLAVFGVSHVSQSSWRVVQHDTLGLRGAVFLLYACRWRAPVVALAIIGSLLPQGGGRQGDGQRVDHHSGDHNIVRFTDK